MKKDVISTEKFQRFLKDNYLFKEIVVEKESLPYSLAKEYKGITPTFFILNSDGELVDYLIGSFKLNEFIDKLKKIKEKS
jgi:thioredoxin-related protein